MGDLQETDQASAAVAVAPRVSLADIEAAIVERYDTTGERLALNPVTATPTSGAPLHTLSVCLLVLRNGWMVIGKSAPASAANFNAELGKKLAYEDCIRQLWPLMGYALREKLAVAV
jgi:Phage protein (N4 Gp49/phage Sf6 gene 66) family